MIMAGQRGVVMSGPADLPFLLRLRDASGIVPPDAFSIWVNVNVSKRRLGNDVLCTE